MYLEKSLPNVSTTLSADHWAGRQQGSAPAAVTIKANIIQGDFMLIVSIPYRTLIVCFFI